MCWSDRSPISWEKRVVDLLEVVDVDEHGAAVAVSSSIHSVRARRLPSPVSGSIRAARLSSSRGGPQLAHVRALAQLAGAGGGLVRRRAAAARASGPAPLVRRVRPVLRDLELGEGVQGDRAPQVPAGALGGGDDPLEVHPGPIRGVVVLGDVAQREVGEVVLGVVGAQLGLGDRQEQRTGPLGFAEALGDERLVHGGPDERRSGRRPGRPRCAACAAPRTGRRSSAGGPRAPCRASSSVAPQCACTRPISVDR